MTGCTLIDNDTMNSDGFPMCSIDKHSQSLAACDHYTRYMGYNGRHTCASYEWKYRECLSEDAAREAAMLKKLVDI